MNRASPGYAVAEGGRGAAVLVPTRERLRKSFACLTIAGFLIQSCSFGNLAYARQVPTIQIPKRTVRVVDSIDEEKYNPCDGTNAANGTIGSRGTGATKGSGSPSFGPEPKHNSQNPRDSVWGYGWYTDIDQFFTLNPNGTLTWTDPAGSELTYFPTKQEPGQPAEYANPINTYTSLTVTALTPGAEPQTIVQREKDGTEIRFERQASTTKFLLAELTDRNSNPVTYTRDAQGRVTQAVDVHGRSLAITYNAAGKVESVADADFAGRTVTYLYDASGNKVSETGPNGTISYVYDANHRITEITYPNGGKRTYTYDAQGRVLIQSDDDDNNKLTYVYEPNRTLVTDAPNHMTTYEYIEKHGIRRVSKIIDAKNQEITFQYDANMNLLSQTDPLNRATQFEYDAWGNVLAVVDPSGKRTEMQYEQTFNQATQMTDPKGTTTNLSYDSKGNLLEVRDSVGNATNMTYDQIGHVTATQDPLGKTTNFGYDARGALNNVTDPLNRITSMVRDELGRVTQSTDPKGKASQFAYDAAGDLIQVTDAIGGVTTYEYVAGRNAKPLSKVTDAERQGTGKGTSFAYDLLDRLTSVTNALGQTKSFAYDKKGNITSVTDAKNQTVTFTYDQLDQLITKTLPEGPITHAYDAAGKLTRVTHHNGSEVQMTYDSLDRVIQVTQKLPNNHTVQIGYGYDDNGNRTSLTTPWGNFSYAYDGLNRLTSITNPQGRLITFAYNSLGRRTKMLLPNGIEANYTYDDAGQLSRIDHKRTSDSQIIAFAQYTYGAAGNRLTMVDDAGMHSFGYDDLRRLTSAAHAPTSHVPTKSEAFTYDAVGNRLSDSNIVGYVYDDAGRMNENSVYSYQYDNNGNQISKTDKDLDETTALVYNSEDKLSRITLPDGTLADYKYDGQGKRIEISIGPSGSQVTRRFIYDNEDILAILDESNALVALFTHGPGIDEPLLFREADSAEYFILSNGLGSVIAHADSGGVVVERIEYEGFGRPVYIDIRGPPVISDRSITKSPFAFAAREWDADQSAYYFRARYFDPFTGRFQAEDQAHSLNNYSFVWNNPLRYQDPTGEFIHVIPFALILGYLMFAPTMGNTPGTNSTTYPPGFYPDESTVVGMAATAATAKGVVAAGELAGGALEFQKKVICEGPQKGGRLFQLRWRDTGQPFFRLDYDPEKGLHYHRPPPRT